MVNWGCPSFLVSISLVNKNPPIFFYIRSILSPLLSTSRWQIFYWKAIVCLPEPFIAKCPSPSTNPDYHALLSIGLWSTGYFAIFSPLAFSQSIILWSPFIFGALFFPFIKPITNFTPDLSLIYYLPFLPLSRVYILPTPNTHCIRSNYG